MESTPRRRRSLLNYFIFVWFLLSLTLVILMVALGPETQQIARLPGVINTPTMIGVTFVAGIAFALTLRKRPLRWRSKPLKNYLPQTAWFGALIMVVSLALLVILTLALPIPSKHPLAVIFYLYGVGIVTVTTFALLRLSDSGDRPLTRKWTMFLIVVVFGAALILTATQIGIVPQVNVFDEPGEINLSWSLHSFQAFRWGMFPTIGPAEVGLSYSLFNVINGIWMGFLKVGLVQARLFYLLLGWLGIPFIYLIARRLYGSAAGLAALAIAVTIPLSHNFARPDMFVMSVFSAGLYCYLRGRDTQRPIFHYLAGLAIATGIEAHPYAIRFVIPMALIYSFDYLRVLREKRRWFWYYPWFYFALGGLTFGVYYLVAHILIVPGNGLTSVANVYSNEVAYSDNASVSWLTRMLSDNVTFYRQYFQVHLPEALLFAVGVAAAMWRRQRADWLLLFILGTSLLIGSLLLAHVNPYYWVFNMPFISILGGALIVPVGHNLPRPVSFSLRSATALAIAVVLISTNTVKIGQEDQPAYHFAEIAQKVDSLLPDKITTIIADRIYYLGIYDHRNFITIDDFKQPVQDLSAPQPWALILTSTEASNDAKFVVEMRDYVQATNKALAYCFYSDGYEISVYLPREYLPSNAPTSCNSQSS